MIGDPQLDTIARALAAGEEIDWEAAAGSATGADTAAVLRELRILEGIASFHRSSGPPANHAEISEPSPDQWGELRIIRRIASGSFGDVYEAYDPALARVVALKLIVSSEQVESRRDGVISEAQLLARVRHPNVVTVYGAGRVDGRTGIWMELVRGRTLAEQLAASGPMSAPDAARIARDLCAALAAIHAAGLVHRDVKAQNVMIEDGGRVVLMDLGAGFDQAITAAPLLAGTPAYAAPEVLRGEPATPRSDLYSLGALLQYLTTGTFPVSGASVSSVRADHVAGRRTPLPTKQFKLPRPFVSVVERALSPDASQRFDSAEVMGCALERVVSAPIRRRKWAIGATAAAVVLVAIGLYGVWFRRSTAAVPPSVVLVGSFENRTGNQSLDRGLKEDLERELTMSPFVRVVPSVRIDDTLKLMQRPLDTELTTQIARDVAIRDGGVGAVVTGRAESLGAGFLLSAQIVDPQTGSVTLEAEERITTASGAADGVRRLAATIRARLGEAPATIAGTEQIPRVTTPSFDALTDYKRAVEASNRGDSDTARILARSAVKKDPTFAAAYTWLAWTLFRTNPPTANTEALDASAHAVSLAATASDWERCWILGSDYYLRKDYKNAAAQYETLLVLKPDDFWAVANLEKLYSLLRDPQRTARYAIRTADLRPNDFWANAGTTLYLMDQGDTTLVTRYAQRALTLLTPEAARHWPDDAAVVLMARADLAWWERDARRSSAEVQRALAHPVAAAEPTRSRLLVSAGSAYLSMGQVRLARQLFDRIEPDFDRMLLRAAADYYSGDVASTTTALSLVRYAYNNPQRGTSQGPFLGSMLIRVGRTQAARDVLDQYAAALGTGTSVVGLRGQLAAATGDADEAIMLLRSVVAQSSIPGSAQTQRAARALSDAWFQKGNRELAIDTLQLATKQIFTNPSSSGASIDFTPNLFRLAALYRLVGKSREADDAEARASQGLDLADPEFVPTLRALAVEGLSHEGLPPARVR